MGLPVFFFVDFIMKRMKELLYKNIHISGERLGLLKDFCRPLNLRFKNYDLLDLAFHHRSSTNESNFGKRYNNERLEFLGDSVLGMVTAAFLYSDMDENPEGDLSKVKASVVSEKALAPIALQFGIDKMLVMGKGAELNNEAESPSILADCMEAIIGAYYLDSGYEAAEKYVLSFIIPEVRKVQHHQGVQDYKSLLQEYYQKKYQMCPVYELISKTGPDHDQTFNVCVHLKNITYGPVSAKNKKQAEQNAAKIAWETLNVCKN